MIDLYCKEEINETTFCDEYYYSYSLEINNQTLDENEKKIFKDLEFITERFSEFSQDFKLAPGAYTDKEELKTAIANARLKLASKGNL